MTMFGRFRLRREADGTLQIWAQGWRLEIPALVVVPAAVALAFLVSPIAMPLRITGSVAFVAATWVVWRLTRLGFRLSDRGIQVVDVLRSQRVAWDDVAGFVGERNGHEGRAVLMSNDGTRVPAPGTFAAEDMDPYGDEGDESIVDELNRLIWGVRRGDVQVP